MTKPRYPLSREVLNNGDARHCEVWEFPGPPRLKFPDHSLHAHRRPRRPVVPTRPRPLIHLTLLLNALRKSR